MSILEPGDRVRSVLMGDTWRLVRLMEPISRGSWIVAHEKNGIVRSEHDFNLLNPNKYTLITQSAKSRLELIES